MQEINSHETVQYIANNYNKIVNANLQFAPPEVVEDHLSTLVTYLMERPRFIPDPVNWVIKSLKRKVLKQNRALARFKDNVILFDDRQESIFDQMPHPGAEMENFEHFQEINHNFKNLMKIVDTFLTNKQKDIIYRFIKDDSEFKDPQMVELRKSIRRLKDVVKIKSNNGKVRLPADLSKKARVIKHNQIGRPSSFTPEKIEKLRELCASTEVSLRQIAKIFGVSDTAIKLVIKKNKIHYKSRKSPGYTLPFLKESARMFKNRAAWQRHSPAQYQRARKMGWLDECIPKAQAN